MGRSVDVQGRLFQHIACHPEINHNPYIRLWDAETGEMYYVHRRVAEEKLGRKLEPGEVVHHADGNKQNNGPANIMIFSSQRAHMLYEHYQERVTLGIGHVFSIEAVLEFTSEWMVR